MNTVLTMLNREQLFAVMQDSGYGTDGMLEAQFVKVTESGKFMYEIRYLDPDTDEGEGRGNYFVWIDENGQITGDF